MVTGTMSAICQNFVQNAWRKDLCSNCFKSKDEHNQEIPKSPEKLNKTIESIIKNNYRKSKLKRSVEFTTELSHVIGFGGEDWSSNSEDENESNELSENEAFDSAEEEEEEDIELQKLTKANTHFNSIILVKTEEVKKSCYTQLMLGKPQVDSDGRKQTLLVSVTPFGQESLNIQPKIYSKSISHIPISKSNKDIIGSKENLLLTSCAKNETFDKEEKSLLDEISETLGNATNPIQIITQNKIENNFAPSNPDIKPNKESIKEEEAHSENKDEVCKLTTAPVPERKNGISRATVIKRDKDKPVVYQTSIAKIELTNNKKLNTNTKKILSNNKSIKVDTTAPEANTQKDVISDTPQENEQTIGNGIKQQTANEKSISAVKVTNNHNDQGVIKSLELNAHKKIIDLPSHVPTHYNLSISQSRELAGEPDGRADPEHNEPPALPLTTPPNLEYSTSYLHNNLKTCDKPKVPSKPSTIMIRKPIVTPNKDNQHHQNILSTFTSENKLIDQQKPKLEKHDSNGSDLNKAVNKRRAPNPPSFEESLPIYVRHTANEIDVHDGIIDTEKQRQAYSCNSQISNLTDVNLFGKTIPNKSASIPEPAPRRSLSVSSDSLCDVIQDKKKDKRGRFSLKKFLRIGSSKDAPKLTNEIVKIEEHETVPQPKQRLIIVHPSELNGAKVEVLAKNTDYADFANTNAVKKNDYMAPNIITYDQNIYDQCTTKPTPPPRNYDECQYPRPNNHHPPKSIEILNKQKQFLSKNDSKKIETVYANLGEVRSEITPHKPQRTASMREREAQQHKRSVNNYEPINLQMKDSNENVYDYITSGRSSPEYDSNKNSPLLKSIQLKNRLQQRSESNIDVSGEYFKYQNIPRSVSLTYCGSETESEIYSPYSFYGSEPEVTEDDHEWIINNGKTHKLRSRKGRSIVHKNLEDNYGAVVVANHEALAQVLENIRQTVAIQPALRGLKTSSNLRWSDFSIRNSLPATAIGQRTFQQASWGNQHVTLVISTGPISTNSLSLGTFSLVPITEFSDLIPVKYLPIKDKEDLKHLQATVSVLPYVHVNSIQSYSEYLKSKSTQNNDDIWKDACFILLQLVNALKTLQAQGIEELPLSLNTFVLCREVDKDLHNKLYVLQGVGEDIIRKKDEDNFGTLCMCASTALTYLQSTMGSTNLIKSLLCNERAVSLTQVKSILEFSLWGPTDVALGNTVRERELALQRWLDLQRATVLHGLVCTKIHLTVYEECHLLFLVRSNSRIMCEATLLLESSNT